MEILLRRAGILGIAEAMNYLEHEAKLVICIASVIGAQTSRAIPGIQNPTGEQQAYGQISGHPPRFSCLRQDGGPRLDRHILGVVGPAKCTAA